MDRIESPVRKSRCTIPDGIESTKELEFNLTKNRKQQLAPQEGEEEESQDQDVAKDIVKKQRNNQSSKNVPLIFIRWKISPSLI